MIQKKQAEPKLIPLKELNLTNRFFFSEVMEDRETLQDVLSILLERDITLLTEHETEKEMRVSPLARSIRVDVFAMDQEEQIYSTEMQTTRKNDLERRSRYYQSLLDSGLLETGITSYNELKDTYLIMIMTFDLFGCKKYRYTFTPMCHEEPGLQLADGAVRIFLSTKGENAEEVSPELIEFLHYIEHTAQVRPEEIQSERIRRIHSRVCQVRSNEEIGVKYMQAWEEKMYDKMEAREEGRKEGEEVGWKAGKKEGEAYGIVETYKELGASKEDAVKRIRQKCGMSEKEAKEYVAQYW